MRRNVATIGFFDGVHRGHRYLIEQVREKAIQRHLHSMLVTFNEHPRQVLSCDYSPKLLSTLSERKQLLLSSEIDSVKFLDFTEEMSRMSARDFMLHILQEQLNVEVLVIGYDHRFGHDKCTHEDYIRWGEELGIKVVPAKELEGEKISSSIIRKAIQKGDLPAANRMLGHPYQIEGLIIEGHQVGRQMGFPTANLLVDACKILPPCAAYAVRATLPDGTKYNGMLNIGQRPTLQNGRDISVEVHLFHYQGDLYGENIRLDLYRQLRTERTFLSLEALRTQLEEDARMAEDILSATPL